MQLQRITRHTKPPDREERWHVVDADGERLGRLASRVAGVLQGKHRPDYSRHLLGGDFVIVVNASKIGLSGNKRQQKIYYRHTGYIGHLRQRTLEEMLDKFPERVIERAVKGMLPRNRLGRRMLRRLKVYAAGEHPHEAQVRAGMGKPKQEPAAPTRPRARRRAAAPARAAEAAAQEAPIAGAPVAETPAPPTRRRTTRRTAAEAPPAAEAAATEAKAPPARRRAARGRTAASASERPRAPRAAPRTRRKPASEDAKPEGE